MEPILTQKAGTELNDEMVKKAVEEYKAFVESEDNMANNFQKRVYDVLDYLYKKSGIKGV